MPSMSSCRVQVMPSCSVIFTQISPPSSPSQPSSLSRAGPLTHHHTTPTRLPTTARRSPTRARWHHTRATDKACPCHQPLPPSPWYLPKHISLDGNITHPQPPAHQHALDPLPRIHPVQLLDAHANQHRPLRRRHDGLRISRVHWQGSRAVRQRDSEPQTRIRTRHLLVSRARCCEAPARS